MTFLFVGGDSDGRWIEAPRDAVVYDACPPGTSLPPERYIKLDVKGGFPPPFFMLCGTVPVDALKRAHQLLTADPRDT